MRWNTHQMSFAGVDRDLALAVLSLGSFLANAAGVRAEVGRDPYYGHPTVIWRDPSVTIDTEACGCVEVDPCAT